MRILLLTITLIIVSSYCYADRYGSQNLTEYESIAEKIYDFRKTRWGMSIEQVRESEKPNNKNWPTVKQTVNKNGNTMLTYIGKRFDRKCYLMYEFGRKGLHSSAYVFDENSNQLIFLLRRELNKKFGQSVFSESTKLTWKSPDKETSIQLDYGAKSIKVMYIPQKIVDEELKREMNNARGVGSDGITESKEQFNFRKTRWGMSIEQVKASEVDKNWINVQDTRPNTLAYRGTLFGRGCFLIYLFEEGKLQSGTYTFEVPPSNIELEKRIKSVLLKKYGNPFLTTTSRTIWEAHNNRTLITLWLIENGHLHVHYYHTTVKLNKDSLREKLLLEESADAF